MKLTNPTTSWTRIRAHRSMTPGSTLPVDQSQRHRT